MIRLHYYSNSVALRLPLIEEEEEVYRIDEIKEFEAVDTAWKETLAQILLQESTEVYLMDVCAGNVLRAVSGRVYVETWLAVA
ncbi:hypothetical protein J6590_023500 [Homalodisca vitripennis]|nr:hypothetical protein J6590_023500 [Homalodisca vitripennis]